MTIDKLQEMDVNVDEIRYIIEKYHSGQSIIVVTGEFSSGKSSFINCYLNKPDFLPYGKTECTPILIDICEGQEESIEVRTVEGVISNVEYTKEKIYELAKYDANNINNILSINIPIQNSGLPKGVHLIDTPGTNTVLKEHEETTNYIIKKADAVLYLFNKVISQTDINHIINVMQYTKNIIFVLTHADEVDNKTGEKYTDGRIEELINEAKKEISKNTGVEINDLLMCSVGSVDGFEKRNSIDLIKELIESYVKTQTEEKRKKIAVAKINSIIKAAIDDYSFKRDILQKNSLLRSGELERKIQKYEREQEVCEREHTNMVAEIERNIDIQEEFCKSELYRLLGEEKESLSNNLNSLNYSERDIEKKAEQMNANISSVLRKQIEEAVNSVSKRAYSEANDNLKNMVDQFAVSMPITITAPEIKDLDDSRLVAKLVAVEKEIEANIKELSDLKASSKEQEILDLERQIHEYEIQKEKVRDKLLQLGAYKPEFETIMSEGGGSAGKIMGRVIGEVADLALLVWNPAGAMSGAAKGTGKVAKVANETAKLVNAADKAKDATTIIRYVGNAASKAAETGKNIKQKRNKIDKIAKTIGKVDAGRRVIIEKVQENAEADGVDEMSVSTMLDMLSIGYWTEKLGGAIGEAIKPTVTTSVEDMENKEDYERRRKEITDESNRLSAEIMDLKDRLLDLDDFGKQRRLEMELKEREAALEVKKGELERLIENNRVSHIERQKVQHIVNELARYENIQKENGEKLIAVIFSEAKLSLIERLTTDYFEKIDTIKKIIEDLSNTATDSEQKIKECEICINTLSECITDAEEWLK